MHILTKFILMNLTETLLKKFYRKFFSQISPIFYLMTSFLTPKWQNFDNSEKKTYYEEIEPINL